MLACGSALIARVQSGRVVALWDLSYILEYANRIAAGQVPYRDFPLAHAPLTFLIQALLIKTFGHAVDIHRWYAAMISAGTVVMTWLTLYQLACLRPCERPMPGSKPGAAPIWISAVLAVPIILLNGCAIVPQPFYDSDAAFFSLTALALLLCGLRSATRARKKWLFSAGMAMTLAALAKQNVGLVLLATLCAFMPLLARSSGRSWRQAFGDMLWVLAGAIGLAILAVAILHWICGLPNVIHWTWTFARSQRLHQIGLSLLPGSSIPEARMMVLSAAAGATVVAFSGTKTNRLRIGYLLIGWPLIWMVCDMHDWLQTRGPHLLTVIPWALMLSLVIAIRWALVGRLLLLCLWLVIYAVMQAAFLSQGVGGSSYSLWPFVVLLCSYPIVGIPQWGSAARATTRGRSFMLSGTASIYVAVLLSMGAWPYLEQHERLQYINTGQRPFSATRKPLLGLSADGLYLPEFEGLLQWLDQNVPPNEAIASIPGEDPIYYASGRLPVVPALMFDNTINPYSSDQWQKLLHDHHVQWIVVKPWTQIRGLHANIDMSQVLSGYQVYKCLPGYIIYRRSG